MQHVFSHQQQFPSDTWASHLPQHPNPHHAAGSNSHAQHLNRLTTGTGGSNGVSVVASSDPIVFSTDGVSNTGSTSTITNTPSMAMPSVEERRVLQWISQLMDPNTREAALLELSKKREQFPQLALILWHSFGTCDLNTAYYLLGVDSR